MGLTLHYRLRWTPSGALPPEKQIEELVATARRQILQAGLGRASAIRRAGGGPFNGDHFVCVDREAGRFIDVPPAWGRLFTLEVGKGCEPAVLGLCRYPAELSREGQTWPTQLSGWQFNACSKTQYASLHGWEHFRRCHLAIVAALGIFRELGAQVKISDEGGYWPRRSERTLRDRLDQMNGLVASLVGAVKDAFGEDAGPPVQAPILAHPNFERLEAEGVAQHGRKIAAAIEHLANVRPRPRRPS